MLSKPFAPVRTIAVSAVETVFCGVCPEWHFRLSHNELQRDAEDEMLDNNSVASQP